MDNNDFIKCQYIYIMNSFSPTVGNWLFKIQVVCKVQDEFDQHMFSHVRVRSSTLKRENVNSQSPINVGEFFNAPLYFIKAGWSLASARVTSPEPVSISH